MHYEELEKELMRFIDSYIYYAYYFSRFKSLIKAHAFYEAHEVLEEIWFPRRRQKDRKTLILRGFINAAVAFELYKRGKRENALRVWQTYLKHSAKIELNEMEFLHLKDFLDTFALNYFNDLIKVGV